MTTHDCISLRVAARTGAAPDQDQDPVNVDIEIDDARRRLLRAEAAGVEELLDDTLGRMQDALGEVEDQRALIARLVERLLVLRDAERGVDRILRMRQTGE